MIVKPNDIEIKIIDDLIGWAKHGTTAREAHVKLTDMGFDKSQIIEICDKATYRLKHSYDKRGTLRNDR